MAAGNSPEIFGFDPRSVSGCQLWLDAANDKRALNTSLSSLPDRSGNGNVVTPVSGETISLQSNSLNVLPTYLFGGNRATISSFNWTNNFTQFVVVWANAGNWLTSSWVAGTYQTYTFTGNWYLLNMGTSTLSLQDSVNALGTPVIPAQVLTLFCIGYSSGMRGTANYSVNGVSRSVIPIGTGYSGTPTTAPFFLNGNGTGAGDVSVVGEFLHYNRSLTTSERQQVEGYLAWKWNLNTNLVGGLAMNPTKIPGCKLWLDGADRGSMTLSGTSVTQWNDKSGNAYNMTGTSYPVIISNGIAGNSYVQFTQASSQKLSNSSFPASIGNGVATYFFVERNMSISSGNGGPFGYTVGPDQGIIFQVNGGLQPFYLTSAFDFPVTSPTQRILHIYMPNATTGSTGRVNGSTKYNGSNILVGQKQVTGVTYSGAFEIGRAVNGFMNVDFCELLIYNRKLNISEIEAIEGYLATKWFYRFGLPTSHPSYIENPDHTFSRLPVFARTFQPTDLSNLKLWWDSALPSSFTYTTGSNINTWSDRVSGIPLTYSNTPPTLSATGGVYMSNPSSAITAASQILVNSNVPGLVVTQRNTVIVAHYPLSTDNYRSAFVMSAPYVFTANPTFLMSVQCGINDGNGVGSYNGAGNWYSLQQAAYCNSVAPRVDSLLSDASNFVYTNGVEGSYTVNNIGRGTFTTGSATSQIAVVIGGTSVIHGNREYNGYIYEMLFYDTALSFSDIRRVEGYLANKWKFQQNLVNTHPYYRIPPSIAMSFAPVGLPGCRLWLDAVDSSTLILSGTNVRSWDDKSGNGYHFTSARAVQADVPPVLTQNGLNKLPVITFTSQALEGVDVLDLSNVTSFSVFVVGTTPLNRGKDGYGGGWSLTCGSNQTSSIFTSIGTAQYTAGAQATTSPLGSSIARQANTTTIIQYNSGQYPGTVSFSNYTLRSSTVGFHIGSGSGATGYTNGYMAEVIVYNIALSTDQRQQVEGYLAWKWGLQTFLPSTHPHYRWRPEASSTPPILTNNLILNLDATTYSSGSTLWIPSYGNNWNLVSSPTVSPGLTKDNTTVLTTNGSSSYIYDPTGVNFTGAFTIDIWVFVPTPSTNGNILAETNGGYQWTDMYISNSTFYGATYQLSGQSLGTCTANTWTNLCITNSANGTSTYVGYSNGAQVSTTSYTRTAPGGNSFFYLASSAGNPNFGYKALSVGAIKFYRSALTQAQVKQNYDALSSRFILPL